VDRTTTTATDTALQTWREIFGADWSKFQPGIALSLVAGVALPLAVAMALGQTEPAILMAAGAFSVGFGAFQQLRGSRLLPMLLAASGMCITSWIGTLTARSSIAAVSACALAGIAYALISQLNQGSSWIALQCTIWLVISTAFPAHGLSALYRGTFILIGGLLQTGIVSAFVLIGCERPVLDLHFPLARGRGVMEDRSPRAAAIRTALTVTLAAVIYRALPIQNAYWIPMTAVIILRTGLRQTMERGVARTVGTMLGAGLATMIVTVASPCPWALAAGIVAFAWAAYTFFYVNYAYYALSLTSYVVFLLSLVGLEEHSVVIHRVVFTAIGGGLALTMRWLSARTEAWSRHRSPAP
jgi:hypothetical protein